MSLFDNAVAIYQQQQQRVWAQQDAAIAKAKDFWRRYDAIKEEQANTSNGVWPSASEFIRNSGYDPNAVAFTQSPFWNIYIDPGDLTLPKVTQNGDQAAEPPSTTTPYGGDKVTPQTLDYLNADLAKHYGMSRETAYQEALANTSYQREMADMRAAGLNPSVLYGAGRGSGAGGVSYVSSGSGGGRFGSGGKKADDKLFSSGTYYLISALAGVSTALAMKNPNGYWIGSTVAQGLLSAADAIW